MFRARAYTIDSCYVGLQLLVAIHGFVRGGTGLRGGSVSNPMKYDRYGRRARIRARQEFLEC